METRSRSKNLATQQNSAPGQLPKRTRWDYTADQLEILWEEFEKCTRPSRAEVERIAERIKREPEVTKTWFKNQRQRVARQERAQRQRGNARNQDPEARDVAQGVPQAAQPIGPPAVPDAVQQVVNHDGDVADEEGSAVNNGANAIVEDGMDVERANALIEEFLPHENEPTVAPGGVQIGEESQEEANGPAENENPIPPPQDAPTPPEEVNLPPPQPQEDAQNPPHGEGSSLPQNAPTPAPAPAPSAQPASWESDPSTPPRDPLPSPHGHLQIQSPIPHEEGLAPRREPHWKGIPRQPPPPTFGNEVVYSLLPNVRPPPPPGFSRPVSPAEHVPLPNADDPAWKPSLDELIASRPPHPSTLKFTVYPLPPNVRPPPPPGFSRPVSSAEHAPLPNADDPAWKPSLEELIASRPPHPSTLKFTVFNPLPPNVKRHSKK